MMTTGSEAYFKAKQTGLLSKLRLEVYAVFCDKGQLTAGELIQTAKEGGFRVSNSGTLATRISELVRFGVLYQSGQKKCSVTGYSACVYAVTGNLPVKPPKQKSLKEKKKDILNFIAQIGKEAERTHQTDLRLVYTMVKKM